jgi:hypothetical protein
VTSLLVTDIRPHHPAFLISDIRPENEFDFLDIRPDTRYGTENSPISGQIEEIPVKMSRHRYCLDVKIIYVLRPGKENPLKVHLMSLFILLPIQVNVDFKIRLYIRYPVCIRCLAGYPVSGF